MRYFIAIDLNEDIKKRIGELIERLKPSPMSVKWVKQENLHITVKFLGEVNKLSQIDKVKEILRDIASRMVPFHLNLSGTGFFPDEKRPRVLWVGIKESDELLWLFSEVDKRLSLIGFSEEKRGFSGHVTIARFKDLHRAGELIKDISTYKDIDFGSIGVKEIILMESILRPEGAIYKCVERFSFKERRKDE